MWWFITGDSAIDFEVADDRRAGPCELGEELVDIDQNGPSPLGRDEVEEAVVENSDGVRIGISPSRCEQARLQGSAKERAAARRSASSEDRELERPG